jgi:fumarate reductase iron-sulfur subunit
MSTETNKMIVKVWRGEKNSGVYETFSVPKKENQTVLDVVTWIQQNLDPNLSYRFACRVGMCGSCAMMVNNTPRWTCRTHVKKVLKGDTLEIAPLRNLPPIKDLVVDMDPFFDKWVAAGGHHAPSASRYDQMPQIPSTEPERAEANKAIECINCAVCYAACDTVTHNENYLGPAALQRAWTLVNDQKVKDRGAILDTISAKGGCHNCHSQGSCTLHCPNGLDPMRSIAGLKAESIKRSLKGN